MIEVYKRISKAKELEKVNEISKNSWIRVIDPSSEEIQELVDKFKLSKELIIDGLDVNETPRLEKESEGIYIFMRVPTKKILDQSTSSFLLILTKDNLITISKTSLEVFNSISSGKISFYTNRNERNIIKILYLISREFDVSVRRIYKEVRAEKRHLDNLTNKDLKALVQYEDLLNDYNYSFRPLVDLYEKVLKLNSLKFSEKDRDFVEDLITDMNQTANLNSLTLKTISNMRNYFSVTVSSRLNDIITVLTVFTIFLSIPTLIASIYGMNIKLPLQESKYILPVLISLLFILWAVFLGAIKWKKII